MTVNVVELSNEILDLISDRSRNRHPHHFKDDIPSTVGVTPKRTPIALMGGMPNYQFFPIADIDIKLRTKPFDDNKIVDFKVPIINDGTSATLDVRTALQYSDSIGLAPLRDQIHQFVERVVRPAYNGWDVITTLGGSDGILKTFDLLVDPGDVILFEEFTFTPVLNMLKEKGGIAVPITLKSLFPKETTLEAEFDYYDEIENLLSNWKTLKPDLKFPKALYTIPNGHNPLGVSQSLEHKKKIYNLAEKYNFIIIEDEPYSYLNYTPYSEDVDNNLTNDDYIKSLRPSFETFDISARVIRIETLSKIFAPGMRLGFIVAHKDFVKYYGNLSECTTKSPNGYSQIILNNAIIAYGGVEGWIHWITQVRNEYLKRKNAFVRALINTDAYKKGLISPIDPACGMFVSVIVNVEKHKDFVDSDESYRDLMNKFFLKGYENGVTFVLGQAMSVKYSFSASRSNFVRASISYVADESVLEDAAQRFSDAALEFFDT